MSEILSIIPISIIFLIAVVFFILGIVFIIKKEGTLKKVGIAFTIIGSIYIILSLYIGIKDFTTKERFPLYTEEERARIEQEKRFNNPWERGF